MKVKTNNGLIILMMLSLIFSIAAFPAQAAQSSLTDKQKQTEILNMANNHRNKLPVELVLAVIRQEGGKGAFYTNSYAYIPSLYYKNSGLWAQPKNGDGIMQVTKSSGFDKHKPYTQDKTGYDGAITDGCAYLNNQYTASKSSSLVYATLHYNTGPNSLYIYFNNMGDKNYLKNVATNLDGFVPNVYSIKNQNLVSSLNKGQQILDTYLYKKSIKPNQSASYYKAYQSQLDAELKKI